MSTTILQTVFLLFSCCIVASVFGQTCSNSNNNLLMTPTLRSKVLNVLNVARNKLESGQLLLNNGKYALQAATLPDLEWSCEMEEEIFEYMEDACPSFPNFNLMTSNLTWVYSRYDETNVETFVDAMLQENEMFLTGTHYTQFARHNLMVHVYPVNHIIAFSDKAQYVACAIQNCDIHTFNDGSMPWIQGDILNNIYCKISLTEELEFKDEIYQVSPSANYIPPTQDVVCKNTERTVDQREAVLEKINAARSEISLGTYSLPNGEPVVSPAQPLSPLVWSCEDETAILYEGSCESAIYNPETQFIKTVTGVTMSDWNTINFSNWFSELGTEFFVSNPNFNFLSTSPNYATVYPAAFAFSKNAESVACGMIFCFDHSDSTMIFNFVCQVKPLHSLGEDLY